jgi:uncharacterized cupredoxin-like copper-binding protein
MINKCFRGCIIALMLVAVAGCGSSKASNSTATTASTDKSGVAADGGQAVSIDLTDFMIMPSSINVKAGAITFNARNDGHSVHNFEIKSTDDSKSLGGTKDLEPGKSGSATITLQKGTYIGYCSEPGHESLGMKVSVVVS